MPRRVVKIARATTTTFPSGVRTLAIASCMLATAWGEGGHWVSPGAYRSLRGMGNILVRLGHTETKGGPGRRKKVAHGEKVHRVKEDIPQDNHDPDIDYLLYLIISTESSEVLTCRSGLVVFATPSTCLQIGLPAKQRLEDGKSEDEDWITDNLWTFDPGGKGGGSSDQL